MKTIAIWVVSTTLFLSFTCLYAQGASAKEFPSTFYLIELEANYSYVSDFSQAEEMTFYYCKEEENDINCLSSVNFRVEDLDELVGEINFDMESLKNQYQQYKETKKKRFIVWLGVLGNSVAIGSAGLGVREIKLARPFSGLGLLALGGVIFYHVIDFIKNNTGNYILDDERFSVLMTREWLEEDPQFDKLLEILDRHAPAYFLAP